MSTALALVLLVVIALVVVVRIIGGSILDELTTRARFEDRLDDDRSDQ